MQTPDKLKVYLYSGNFSTAQGAQIAGGIYVDQGDITLTAANNFVFTGDLFARNISISNGGPTSLLYKPVFTSIIPPANSTPPSVSIAQPVPPVIAGVPANSNYIAPATITLTATATAATGNTISKIEFYQGATLIGTATAPTVANGTNYSIIWSNVAANSYSVTAKATDNKNGTTSTAPITVNVINNTPPTVSLTASPANATAPATIILNATAADTDGTISKVEFFNGATSIATVTQPPYKTNWENVTQGNYSITAKATDNLGATTTSAPVPVAVTKNVPKMYDIHTDHLNTPRVITDNTGTEVWRWDSAPFGETLPNEQPQSNVSKFVWNQRFPGQYYDEETGLHYNYFRDYDPSTGRYAQSDPIGLGGGVNVFACVTGNPVGYMDPFGLVKKSVVPKEVVENVQDFVNTVTQKALTPEQITSLTDKVISEVSVFQVPSLLGFKNGMPVELTKNQVETIKKIIKNLGENFPDDPAVKVIVDRFPKVIKDPKYCIVK